MTHYYTDLCLEDDHWTLTKIKDENKRQLKKWGIQNHTAFQWLTYTTEELGELAAAIGDFEHRKGRRSDVVKEAIQVATLALKIAEMFAKWNERRIPNDPY